MLHTILTVTEDYSKYVYGEVHVIELWGVLLSKRAYNCALTGIIEDLWSRI